MTYKIEFTGTTLVRANSLQEATVKFIDDRDNLNEYTHLRVITCRPPKFPRDEVTGELLLNGLDQTGEVCK